MCLHTSEEIKASWDVEISSAQSFQPGWCVSQCTKINYKLWFSFLLTVVFLCSKVKWTVSSKHWLKHLFIFFHKSNVDKILNNLSSISTSKNGIIHLHSLDVMQFFGPE